MMLSTFVALAALLQTPKGADRPAWETFTSASGFSVSLPGTPVEQKDTQYGPAGPTQNITVISKGGDSVFMVMKIGNTTPITKALEAQFFKELLETTGKTAKILSDKEITHEGHPGRDYLMEIPGKDGEMLVTRARYVLTAPETTFNMQVIRSKAKPAPDPAEVTAFFDSLKLVDLETARKLAKGPKLEFKTFARTDAGFSILMPGKPDEASNETKTAKGTISVRAYASETPLGLFAMTVYDYGPDEANAPAAAKTEMLIRICDAFVANDKGKILQRQSVEFHGSPAHMIRYTLPTPATNTVRLGETRAVMVGPRVFLMTARAPRTASTPPTRRSSSNRSS